MDIPSIAEVHQMLEGNTAFSTDTYYTHVDVKIINDLKQRLDELEATVRSLEVFMQQQDDHIFDLETRLQKFESDGR